jgi:plastocyanin
MEHSHYIGPILLLIAGATTLAACGGGGGGSSGASASPSTVAAAPVSAAAQQAVAIRNFSFMPRRLTVKKGARITISNRDTTAHTATSDDGSSFDTGSIDPGSSSTITLNTAGRVTYHCSIHPFMHGTIIVQGAGGSS